ncbi:pyridoxal-phosphate dependent enzyme [Pacificimonas sp. WHA3]|uniref:Pyridoxal-phosphate dependent enzyme n=1 Tax=Pacificimonas pallii TaxID=2827236 RepID=A0ABS6SAA4_9SPHN|nr:pyridoxal-phosphate dependent enzyme [Pacificimonas pallii]MBV7255297.1 pyridoxal-phosphate dependent enzyme [Pacificimonas pallii]
MTSVTAPLLLPTLSAIRAAQDRLAPYILRTPLIDVTDLLGPYFGAGTRIAFKLELMQHTGSFKLRGALNSALNAGGASVERGLCTVSSGNHGIAVAHCAKLLGLPAKIVIVRGANAACVDAARVRGAKVEVAEDVASAFEMGERLADEGWTFIHPWEGENTTIGAATTGMEIAEQMPDIDTAIVAIGGGGLCTGLAASLKQLDDRIELLAVEPEGAATMAASIAAGMPVSLAKVETIAGCLAPHFTLPYSFGICAAMIDELVTITDAEMRGAMAVLLERFKLLVEPGGAAALAGALCPFHDRLAGRSTCIMICGANIAPQEFDNVMAAGPAARFI